MSVTDLRFRRSQKSQRAQRISPHVVHVAPYYPPHIGGLETVADAIAQGLASTHVVDVLTSNCGARRSPRLERHGNLTVRRLRTVELAHTPVMPSLLWHLLRLPRHAVIHVHAAVAFCPEVVWLAAKILRRRYVVHFHLETDASGIFGFLLPWYKSLLLGRVLRASSRVVAVSPDQPAVLVREYGVAARQIVTIPNGTDSKFSVTPRREAPVTRAFRWLFVGRLVAQKNVGLLLEAMSVMSQEAELVIVGDGEQRATLEALARRLGLDGVSFAGAQRGDDLLMQYRQADAFVLPSRKESTGLVLLEAMATGLPVVATNVEGSRETVGPDGLLVEPNARALAEAMDRVTADRSLWSGLARRSAARAEQHSWSEPLERFRMLYAAVLAS
ncbi:glycosyltransferase family 4 protein [Mycobacterium sp. 94-17]|uniref:glycosyltransferase family 4 protein n=1 Tax=Mycobacterium sp. 94-17 TaxID=2986147 RepID=UPI002D1EA8C4|nr:glycosyltransferase family 4 protein [Mycobacterium sp. 94-17]MEB4210076.1 glycosyltransferase family 4 protein [Mycobacterium sp. 94-17]